MKLKQQAMILVFLGLLFAGSLSAVADEKPNQLQTALGINSLSGYSDVSITQTVQSPERNRHEDWWVEFLSWFGFDF